MISAEDRLNKCRFAQKVLEGQSSLLIFDEIEDAKRRKVPFIIPIGTIEYHAHHASCGCDTMVINGILGS